MDFELNEEQRMFRDSVRSFALRHLAEGALARAHAREFPADVARLMADNGLFGIMIPESDGGVGGTLLDAVMAIEEVALVCPRSADVLQAGNFGAIRTLAEFATPAQKERYYSDLLSGRTTVSVAMTEPGAGSAVTELTTSLRPDGTGWRLSGQKCFTTNSDHSAFFVVYCRFGPGLEGIGSIILERGAEGFSIGEPSYFLNGEAWCPLYFDDVFIPPENVLLGPGGFKRQMSGFNVERIGNAARSYAYGRFCLSQARDYALNRRQFGRPIADFQGIQWKFAQMEVGLQSAQLLLYRCATAAARELPDAMQTAVAKYACNKIGFDCANEAVQIMGGLGFSEEALVEFCFRKCKGWQIAGGSLEVMLNRIAEGVFGRKISQRRQAEQPRAGAS
ncbi:acyl-CoA dehydrogenase family protein [Mesorhizobium sp. AD1-1]|uniref:acyl-CoA dehydrogenase family protein n=1 Tax=Mesorhizobium sp. AD1-1 TaxID=2876621 RepID=UPI001CCB909F|nr:acyl-CoA dehydrogenase family protein [Mesorhizobium sp. AD1-1]MBZ9719210.1 acyl-CoA dehydrogenase family protein [Mesorhizobium sp. AD1-1]